MARHGKWLLGAVSFLLWPLVLSGKCICPQVQRPQRSNHRKLSGVGEWLSSLEGTRDVHTLTAVQADSPATLPTCPGWEAHLLLDGIQDAPHVLIHLQALQQSSFTGKREKGLATAPRP